jgi:hypothetical protein
VAIEAIAIEVKAIIHDGDNDETSSAEDPDADKRAYASVFQAWGDGKISGTAEEVFEAVNKGRVRPMSDVGGSRSGAAEGRSPSLTQN